MGALERAGKFDHRIGNNNKKSTAYLRNPVEAARKQKNSMTVKIAIGSGKGGTGKTMTIANIAVQLARQGKRVYLVDLDVGGADTHILYGLFKPKRTLTDFLTRQVETIEETAHIFYSYHGLKLIPGTGETLQTSNMTFQEKKRLLRALDSIDADVLLLDVGAGTSYHALDFFMNSDIQICVTLPDPTSIMDLYNFLQLATIRKILGSFLSRDDVAQTLKNKNFQSLSEVFELAEAKTRGAREKAQQGLRYFHPLLIVNRDSETGSVNKARLKEMISRYLGIDISPGSGQDRQTCESVCRSEVPEITSGQGAFSRKSRVIFKSSSPTGI